MRLNDLHAKHLLRADKLGIRLENAIRKILGKQFDVDPGLLELRDATSTNVLVRVDEPDEDLLDSGCNESVSARVELLAPSVMRARLQSRVDGRFGELNAFLSGLRESVLFCMVIRSPRARSDLLTVYGDYRTDLWGLRRVVALARLGDRHSS